MKRVVLAYFSPTHTTEKVAKAIARGMGIDEIVDYNLTLGQDQPLIIEKDDLIILGGPVYVGRIPKIARERMAQIKGHGQGAVCLAVYGNNKVGDALAELGDLARQANLVPVAGASFIGEHSYANDQRPIASGRPDKDDLILASTFGRQVIELIDHQLNDIHGLIGADFPGDIPSQAAPTLPQLASIANSDCRHCHICIEVCPVGAIDHALKCDATKCMCCFACVKSCPYGARELTSPRIEEFSLFLSKLDRKEPVFYGV